MRPSRQRVAWVPVLRPAPVRGASDLRRVEGEDVLAAVVPAKSKGCFVADAGILRSMHDNRLPAPGSVLSGVEALGLEGVGDVTGDAHGLRQERFRLKVHPTAGAGACVAGGRYVDGAGGVVAAESDWRKDMRLVSAARRSPEAVLQVIT